MCFLFLFFSNHAMHMYIIGVASYIIRQLVMVPTSLPSARTRFNPMWFAREPDHCCCFYRLAIALKWPCCPPSLRFPLLVSNHWCFDKYLSFPGVSKLKAWAPHWSNVYWLDFSVGLVMSWWQTILTISSHPFCPINHFVSVSYLGGKSVILYSYFFSFFFWYLSFLNNFFF